MSGVKKKKKKVNYANRFATILFIAMTINLAFYWLPDSIFGIPVKKVDLLADIRMSTDEEDIRQSDLLERDESGYNTDKGNDFTSTNQKNDLYPETLPTDSALLTPIPQNTNSRERTFANTTYNSPDRHENGNTDSLSDNSNASTKTIDDDKHNTDYLFSAKIEDFTTGHIGLRRFFAALNNIDDLGRPVRIAFVGDSFIEGDILVADFRAKMQAQFGGRGVGFIPITSNVAQYRPTIKQSADGWKSYSIIRNKNRKYVISGLLFEPVSDNALIRFQTVDMYPGLEEVSSLKFIYSKNENADIILRSDMDTAYYELPPTESVTQYEMNGHFKKGSLQFKNAQGLNAIGIALEDNHGVIVDNFSIRGNSGIIMSELDSESCREMQQIRPYDLIVLQYGLNVASDSVREYGWYRNRMISVIEHVQNCFPGADILIMGVSDRSHKRGGEYSTMPAVMSLLKSQRQTAKDAEVAFWSIFAAMGGQNSMVKYVNSNWASKDYTHLSFRGGREVANALYNAIITEKGMYDGDERLIER